MFVRNHSCKRDGDTIETALGIKGDLLAHISRKSIGT